MSYSSRSPASDNAELHSCIDKAIDHLVSLWDRIGIVGEQRTARRGVVLMHVNNLMDEMVREEDLLHSRLIGNVDKLRTELARVCAELSLPVYEPAEGLTILQLEKDLRLQVDSLNKEKQERLRQLKVRSKADQELCDALSMTPYYVPTGCVPTDRQLAELEEHIKGLETEQSKRLKLVSATRQSIAKLLDELELSPNSSFERDVVCESENISISSDSMRALKLYHEELERLRAENAGTISVLWGQLRTLWDRVEIAEEDRTQFQTKNTGFSHRVVLSLKEEIGRCEQLKRQTLQRQLATARQQLANLWDKCYISAEQRQTFTPFYDEFVSEEVLSAHKDEIQKLKQNYDENKEMFEKVARRQQLWTEFLDLEQRANNPDRYFNRGCNLLKEEKTRKKLTAELPKIEQEVSQHIEQWERDTGCLFLVDGLRFDDYVKKQRDEYAAEKENEKLLRQQQKARQMEEEILYGSKPVTPGPKRFAGNTPTKTPNKMRKMNEPPKTPVGSRTRLYVPASPLSATCRSASKEKLHTTTGTRGRTVLADQNTPSSGHLPPPFARPPPAAPTSTLAGGRPLANGLSHPKPTVTSSAKAAYF